MTEVYTKANAETIDDRAGPASFRRQIEAVKDAVRIEDVAADYGEFSLAGAGRLLGRCISLDHEDKTPSMTIFTEEQRFKCFGIGCGAYGDVVDLVQLAEGGPERCEPWEALMVLAQRYGIELPARPRSWYARQSRQAPAREAVDRMRRERVARRVFRHWCASSLAEIEDEGERERETAILWRECQGVALLLTREIEGRQQ